jgi:hypothetical protein
LFPGVGTWQQHRSEKNGFIEAKVGGVLV